MLSLLSAILATIFLAIAFRRLRGTTLELPWAWTLLAFWMLAAADLLATRAAWSFLLTAIVICPGMAMMGARRPHHHAWQLIVGSLWLVIVLPALQFLALSSESDFEIHVVRQVFLVILVAIMVVNILPTRFGWVASGLLAGFVVLFGPLIPWSGVPEMGFRLPLASGLFLAALIVACLLPRPDRSTLLPADRLWLDFRDTFGTLWALRLADRVNRAAQQEGWECRLHWHGFVSEQQEDLDPLAMEPTHQYLRNIVRRFASQAWIDERLEKGNQLP
jgi:hypothetical protein